MVPHKVIWSCKKHISEKYWTYLCSNCVKYFKHRNENYFKSKFQNIKNLIKCRKNQSMLTLPIYLAKN